jgi:hypothetical protein
MEIKKYIPIYSRNKLLIFLIITSCYMIYLIQSQVTNMDYFKYDRLYSNPKFETRHSIVLSNKNNTFKCTNATKQCYGNGVCNSNMTDCTCDPGWYTFPGSYIKCSYHQSRKSIAILLEATVGFGFGHLYIGNYTFFIGKFLFFFFSCYFSFCIFIFVGSINNSNVNPKTYAYTKRASSYFIIPIMIIWYFLDIILFLSGYYKDGYQQPLY